VWRWVVLLLYVGKMGGDGEERKAVELVNVYVEELELGLLGVGREV
jgi:hypothetical protein